MIPPENAPLPWTVWMDGETVPLRKALNHTEAERVLLGYPIHDYMYIESPEGAQYAWNHVRKCWERI